VQANGFVTNRKDAATQVDDELTSAQVVSAADARKAIIQSANNFSFVSFILPDYKNEVFRFCTLIRHIKY